MCTYVTGSLRFGWLVTCLRLDFVFVWLIFWGGYLFPVYHFFLFFSLSRHHDTRYVTFKAGDGVSFFTSEWGLYHLVSCLTHFKLTCLAPSFVLFDGGRLRCVFSLPSGW